jgi:DNA-binding transcriptional MerR regulator
VTATNDAPYTLKRVQELLGLTPGVVRALVAKGFVAPARGPRNELRFTFRDLLLMKTAEGLRRAQVPTRRIVASLQSLRSGLPEDAPLTGLRITSAGSDVAVREASGVREATTGQFLLDFEVQVTSGAIVAVADLGPPAAAAPADWFSIGEALASTDPAKAEQAYRQALAENPAHVDALVNLGALMCEHGRCSEAAALFDAALAAGTSSALVHFNHAIALEDLGHFERAEAAYRAALEIEPAMTDAHYNLALLLERRGDGQGALRHFSAYRRFGGL